MAETTTFRPQPGKQEQFLSSSADICIYGGGAYSGKTYCELLEPLRHANNPKFRCVIFRRTSPQITNPGALWDEAAKIYPLCGGKAYESSPKMYAFPQGATVSFHHLQYDDTVYDWQGSQVCLFEFDELTHFSKKQFFYMLSRARSDCGVKPYIRATCNPDSDSWVAEFLQWWWNPETGLPYEERSGVLRWFMNYNDQMFWADSKQELIDKFGEDGNDAKSVTFISASIYDNPIGMKENPGYLGFLKSLPYVERERLLGRNWKIRATGGNIFKASWFDEPNRYTVTPSDITRWVRYWDLGGSDNPESDFTVGLLMGKRANGQYYVEDIQRGQWSAKDRDSVYLRTLESDKEKFGNVETFIEWVPGIAIEVINRMIKESAGYNARDDHPQGKKASRAQLVSAQCEAGNVKFKSAPWLNTFISECVAFSENEKEYWKDDQVDALSGAFNKLVKGKKQFAVG